MRTVKLLRTLHAPDGTFGYLQVAPGLQILTGELPWRDNKRAASCIPLGAYPVVWGHSNKLGWCYRLQKVPGRTGVAIHPANYCGLAAEGFRQELHGCIALGKSLGAVNGQRILLSSRAAVSEVSAFLNKAPFLLEVANGPA